MEPIDRKRTLSLLLLTRSDLPPLSDMTHRDYRPIKNNIFPLAFFFSLEIYHPNGSGRVAMVMAGPKEDLRSP